MENYKIKSAAADYTGGGIYIYHGELENGLFFSTCDTWESVAICNKPTNTEEAGWPEFYEQYMIEELLHNDYFEFWNMMLNWIIKNKPQGNYYWGDLESRLLFK